MMNRLTMLAAMMLCALMTLPLAHALVDIAAPIDGYTDADGIITFEYYASVPGLTSCAVNLPPYQFPDPDVQNSALNEVEVQNIPDGVYVWNITCSGAEAESSLTRTFSVDRIQPTLTVFAPANGTIPALTVDFIPADDRSATLACEILWNGNTLETLTIASNARTVRSYNVGIGAGLLRIACEDAAGHIVAAERQLTVQPPIYLSLSTDKSSYGPLEPVRLTIDTLNGANVTVDICPNQTGFVACTSALLASNTFPQSITLPYLNRTGGYLVEAISRFGNQTRINTTSYAIENTLVVSVAKNATAKPGVPINLSASASGGVGPYRFTWVLANGTTIANAQSVVRTYTTAGDHTDRVTAFDSANNSREFAFPISVNDVSVITVRVYDNTTGGAINGADVSFDDESAETFDTGLAIFNLPVGKYDLLVSAAGYRYATGEYLINGSRQIDVGLARDSDVPIVTLLQPANGETVMPPVTIAAAVTHTYALTCTLYLGTGDGWFSANGTQSLAGSGTASFTRDLPAGSYQAKIECLDARGRVGTSEAVAFTIGGTAAPVGTQVLQATDTADAQRLQQDLDLITASVEALDKYGQEERDAIVLTGFDRDLRNARRALQQAIRDLDGLQFRTDLDATARETERARILQKTADLLAQTPRSLHIVEKEQWVRYAEDDAIDAAAQQLAGKDSMTEDADALSRLLAKDQQLFTVSTTMLVVEYSYPDGTTRPATVVTRAFTYAPELGAGYRIFEVIPKEAAQSASEIDVVGESEIIDEDPILAFPISETVTYTIPRKVAREHVEAITTLIVRRYTTEDSGSLLSGFAFFSGAGMSSGWGWLGWLLLAIALLYACWYFDVMKQISFLRYKFGRNEKVHYLRVLMHDAEDQLAANEYPKAEMLYKEVRLTYDTLQTPARNDLYDDVMSLVHKMDTYYFNIVMIELDRCLKVDDHEGAIIAYEKLLGTFERLDVEQQNQLIQTVVGLGRRLGLEVSA